MPRLHADSVIVDLVVQAGHQLNELFLVGDQVFVTSVPSSLSGRSTIAPLEGVPESARPDLVDFLKRLDAVSYESTAQLNAVIQRADLWEAIYAELEAYLSSLPFAKADGEPTYYVVDYGDGQHKIECQACEYFDDTVLSAIQGMLRKAGPDWEVILVGGPRLGPQQALSIYQDRVLKRWSTEQFYGDA